MVKFAQKSHNSINAISNGNELNGKLPMSIKYYTIQHFGSISYNCYLWWYKWPINTGFGLISKGIVFFRKRKNQCCTTLKT